MTRRLVVTNLDGTDIYSPGILEMKDPTKNDKGLMADSVKFYKFEKEIPGVEYVDSDIFLYKGASGWIVIVD